MRPCRMEDDGELVGRDSAFEAHGQLHREHNPSPTRQLKHSPIAADDREKEHLT
jgi:hypothetical protein